MAEKEIKHYIHGNLVDRKQFPLRVTVAPLLLLPNGNFPWKFKSVYKVEGRDCPPPNLEACGEIFSIQHVLNGKLAAHITRDRKVSGCKPDQNL
jgi:hypothetical protein